MEDIYEIVKSGKCPTCFDDSADCKHVLLRYNASIIDFVSGYLAKDRSQLNELKKEILSLLKTGKNPESPFFLVNEIWHYAKKNYVEGDTSVYLDYTSYFNLLYDLILYYDGLGLHYRPNGENTTDENIYFIYYSDNPADTLRRFNEGIVDALNKACE